MKKGISLVALVITIIVLIVLTAAVVMNAGGEEGILGKAKKAVTANNAQVAQEKVIIEMNNLKLDALEENQDVYEYLSDATNGKYRK